MIKSIVSWRQEGMLQVVEESSDLGPSEKTGGSDCHSCGLLFCCEVRGFGNKEEREYDMGK